METDNLKLSRESIINILSLRYDTKLSTQLPKLNWKNFQKKEKISTESIEKLIVKSFQKQIHKNTEKTAISLSAGIDSTLALALLKKNFPDIEIKAFSIKFSNSDDETPQASKIAEFFDVEHKIITLENFLVELPKAISISKLPFWDLHWYHIVKNAKKVSNYLISGDGGDELFGGYTFRYQKYFSLVSENHDWNEKIQCYLKCHQRDWVPDQEELFDAKIKFSWEEIHKKLQPFFDNTLSELDKILLADYNGKLLYNFKPINSAFHNYFKMNSITPLLDNEVITYTAQLDSKEKYDKTNNIGKIPLRKILEKYVDLDLLNPKKQGFSVNTLNLWRDYGFKFCQKFLINGNVISNLWINKKWVDKHFNEELTDVIYVNKFLGLLALEIWYRIFVTKEIDSNTKLQV